MKRASSKATRIDFAYSVMMSFRINGVLEAISGGLLPFISPERLKTLVGDLVYQELIEDPNDFFANLLMHAADKLSVSGKWFASVYLLSHGVIKIFLTLALWRVKLWAYPLAIVIFFGFIVYQIYHYTQTHSASMILLSALDAVVIALTWMEHRRLKAEFDSQ